MSLGLDSSRSYPEPFAHWLASYPRSGNTWVRAFLSAYIDEQAFNLNRLEHFPGEPSMVECYVHWPDTEPMTLFDYAALRALVLRRKWCEMSGRVASWVIKAHSANITVHGQPLFPLGYSRSSVYIIRDPRDVLVSNMHFMGLSPDDTWKHMADPNASLHDEHMRIFHFIGSWKMHVQTWTQGAGFPVTVARYEDMLHNPHELFIGILQALEVPVDEKRVARAIGMTKFDKLKSREKAHGFKERPPQTDTFFRKGKAGQWETEVPESVLHALEVELEPEMRLYGYEPVTLGDDARVADNG